MVAHRDHCIPERLGIQAQGLHEGQTRGVEPQREGPDTAHCAVGGSTLIEGHGHNEVSPLAQHFGKESGVPHRKLSGNKNFLWDARENLIRLPVLSMLRNMEDRESDVGLKSVGRIFVLRLHDCYQRLTVLFLHDFKARLACQQRSRKLTRSMNAGPVPIRSILAYMYRQKVLAHIVQSHEKKARLLGVLRLQPRFRRPQRAVCTPISLPVGPTTPGVSNL
mmetsp:Transcript_25542/g.56206  ORF Transcript_25542/g.56206 Transcript_25542/m.56206 type:complete len:221 (-) Transcript_25542:31-693(-)